MRNSFLQWFSFVVALGVLFFVALMLFGVIEMQHKGRAIILVIMALAVIYMNFRSSKRS